MGLFDQITRSLGDSDNKIDYIAMIKWVEQHGGVSGILDKFRHNGFEEVVQSWLGSGDNLPISMEQVQQVLGGDILADLASKLSLDNAATSKLVAEYLPKVIDKLSVDGKEPDGLQAMLLGFLKR